jgi:hypothetical protein
MGMERNAGLEIRQREEKEEAIKYIIEKGFILLLLCDSGLWQQCATFIKGLPPPARRLS